MSAKDPSLDATLKQLLEETPATDTKEERPVESTEAPSAPPKKRTRRTKAQIEADRKAAEDAKKVKEAETSSETKLDDEPAPVETTESEDTTENTEIVNSTPENLPETEDDKLPDVIEESKEKSEESEVSAVETLVPEVIQETEEDKLPDVEEPKEEKSQKRKPVIPGEVYEAFEQKEEKSDPNSLIGKSCILFNATPMYRAPHASMRIKPYRGHVTVLENPKGGFVKVQFLRQGFGLCEGFVPTEVITKIIVGDENERGDKVN